MKSVVVLGSGSWGTALAIMLQRHGHKVTLWARREEAIAEMRSTRENKQYLPNIPLSEELGLTHSLEEAFAGAEIILCAVPSKAVRSMMEQIVPFVKEGQVIVNVAKGLEQGTLLRLSQVIEQIIPQAKICVLSGPSHAEEVARDIPTTCVAACVDETVAKMVQEEFMNPNFRVYTNTDVIGVEIGAAMKNVMALAAGVSDGVGFGDNTKAAIMTRGIAEMTRLGIAMGGKAETFAGLSGIGDLIVTCTSMHSRNRRAGILLGKGYTLDETLAEVKMVVEGVNTAKAALEAAKKYGVYMPITDEMNQVLFEGKELRQAVMDLMTRVGRPE